ncbi:MAG: hypothetical protein HY662_04155 [Chloroflexi bacterium]|nr:hypothetical protein [Chloroflexota bacterium]
MTESNLAKKLRLSPALRDAVINAPPDYVAQLGTNIDTKIESKTAGILDFILLFVQNAKELDNFLPAVRQTLKYDGLLWIAYPKGGSKAETDLNRDILWKAMEKFNLGGGSHCISG